MNVKKETWHHISILAFDIQGIAKGKLIHLAILAPFSSFLDRAHSSCDVCIVLFLCILINFSLKFA